MKVRDLVARLVAMDPELPVIMPGEDDEWCEVSGAYEDLAAIDEPAVQLTDEREASGVRVVRLFGPDEA